MFPQVFSNIFLGCTMYHMYHLPARQKKTPSDRFRRALRVDAGPGCRLLQLRGDFLSQGATGLRQLQVRCSLPWPQMLGFCHDKSDLNGNQYMRISSSKNYQKLLSYFDQCMVSRPVSRFCSHQKPGSYTKLHLITLW